MTAEHKVYDEAIKQVKNEEEVHARHILVPTEDEAKAILAQLKGGADFATLAKEKSKDPGAAEGGDLGYFTKDQMVPEFAEVAFKLDKGQLSDPVKTQFGWHIIKVEDKRIKPTPTFDQVKGQIENYVAHRAQAQLVENLRSAANVERLDKPVEPNTRSIRRRRRRSSQPRGAAVLPSSRGTRRGCASKDARPRRPGRRSSRLAEFIVGPATPARPLARTSG